MTNFKQVMMKAYLFILMSSMTVLLSCKKGGSNSNTNPIDEPTKPKEKGVTLKADGPGNTYALINQVLGGTAYEVPDCVHPQDHIHEEFDQTLNKNVFVFSSHVTPDNDRCENFDRQRTEIKTYGPSPANLKATLGETVTYRWKFKLDANIQTSPSFFPCPSD